MRVSLGVEGEGPPRYLSLWKYYNKIFHGRQGYIRTDEPHLGSQRAYSNFINHLLLNMKYVVKAPGSQKEWNFFHTTNHPVYGSGQGSGNSPHVWTMISSVLLQMLNKEAQGA